MQRLLLVLGLLYIARSVVGDKVFKLYPKANYQDAVDFCASTGQQLAVYDFSQPPTSPNNAKFAHACAGLRCWTSVPNGLQGYGSQCQALNFNSDYGLLPTPCLEECNDGSRTFFACEGDAPAALSNNVMPTYADQSIGGLYFRYFFGDDDIKQTTTYDEATANCQGLFAQSGRMFGGPKDNLDTLAFMCNAAVPGATSKRCWLPGGSSGNGMCPAVTYGETGYVKANLPCTDSLPYTCAASLTIITPDSVVTLTTANSMAYTFHYGADRKSYSDAKAACETNGQALAAYTPKALGVSPDNAAILFLCGQYSPYADKCWMPADPTAEGRCQVVQADNDEETGIMLKNCTMSLPFVCKYFIPRSPPPPPPAKAKVWKPLKKLSPPPVVASSPPPTTSTSPPPEVSSPPAMVSSPPPQVSSPPPQASSPPPADSPPTYVLPPVYATPETLDSQPPPSGFMRLVTQPGKHGKPGKNGKPQKPAPKPSPAVPMAPSPSPDTTSPPEVISPPEVTMPPTYGAGIPTYGGNHRSLAEDSTILEEVIKASQDLLGNSILRSNNKVVMDNSFAADLAATGTSIFLSYILMSEVASYQQAKQHCNQMVGVLAAPQELKLLLNQAKFTSTLLTRMAANVGSADLVLGLWTGGSSQDCSYLRIDSPSMLLRACGVKLPFVCKLVTDSPPVSQNKNKMQVDLYSLDYYLVPVTYHKAQEHCASYNAVLAPSDLPDIQVVCDTTCWVAPAFGTPGKQGCNVFVTDLHGAVPRAACDEEKHPFVCFAGGRSALED